MSPFALTALVSGLELENLAAGIAADLRGFPNAAAGTFLGGTTFLTLAVTGLSAAAAPLEARLPRAVLGCSASALSPFSPPASTESSPASTAVFFSPGRRSRSLGSRTRDAASLRPRAARLASR